MAYVLDDTSSIPEEFAERLRSLQQLATRCEFMEQLLEDADFRRLANELNEKISRDFVRVFHCTKELHPGFFKEQGLRVLSMVQHQREFDALVADHCSASVRARFRSGHADFRTWDQANAREGTLWFCMSVDVIRNSYGGCWRFFKYFGGEAIYWPFLEKDDECLSVLENLGKPAVVELELPGRDLEVWDLAFASHLLSHWALETNPEFCVLRNEGWITRDVTPSEVVWVHDPRTLCPEAME